VGRDGIRPRGSPPRAWGKGHGRACAALAQIFTPTGVGKRRYHFTILDSSEVHPHGRGEKWMVEVQRGVVYGSPPRAWGKGRILRLERGDARFTPTGVGKSARGEREKGLRKVHPHGRGEKSASGNTMSSGAGSPPRAWGKVARLIARERADGFTPTGVGKRQPATLRLARAEVHPHGRGEKKACDIACRKGHGSPPRAWGKDHGKHGQKTGFWFTPTGVGKSVLHGLGHRAGSVHPHGRGEKITGVPGAGKSAGSPPRAWGKV